MALDSESLGLCKKVVSSWGVIKILSFLTLFLAWVKPYNIWSLTYVNLIEQKVKENNKLPE